MILLVFFAALDVMKLFVFVFVFENKVDFDG